MVKKFIFISLVFTLIIAVIIQCDKNPSDPEKGFGKVSGTVKNASEQSVYPAYIFLNNTLLATTDESGNFMIDSIEEGRQPLTCSALDYANQTIDVTVSKNSTKTQNFSLAANSTTGRVFIEFQDGTLYDEMLQADPDMKDWSSEKLFNATTGATLQAKTLQYIVPFRDVFFEDRLIASADVWGQCWFEIQSGIYPIKATCEGYEDGNYIISVLPHSKNYLIIVLERK